MTYTTRFLNGIDKIEIPLQRRSWKQSVNIYGANENNLKRIGKVEIPLVIPILGSNQQFFYRNKMEFSFSDSKWLTLEQI